MAITGKLLWLPFKKSFKSNQVQSGFAPCILSFMVVRLVPLTEKLVVRKKTFDQDKRALTLFPLFLIFIARLAGYYILGVAADQIMRFFLF